ncbi:hypothetical protein [Streptomyces rimosus]|uniref:hypothetical protein n=1 Tax=Streptomyces rimosus TaxID=1927 RepID=UPI000A84527E|nr:hypothetical protein [Streptomyces rimosus]
MAPLLSLADRILRIRVDPHSDEVIARGGDPEAHSILQRSGFVPVVRLHDHYHRLPTGLEKNEEIRLASRAVARLSAVGYRVDHDPSFAATASIPHDLTLGAQINNLARRIREAEDSDEVADVLTELTAAHDGILTAVGEVLTASADFHQDLGQPADPHYANRLRYLAGRLGAITFEVSGTRNDLADRHAAHPHRTPCPQEVASTEREASVVCPCPPAPAPVPRPPATVPTGRRR